MGAKPKITKLEDHIDEMYGKRGEKRRAEFEREYEAFKLGFILQELRETEGLTQQQLAERCGTTKNYISRIENDASDIRLSTIMRIFYEGFGKRLRLTFD